MRKMGSDTKNVAYFKSAWPLFTHDWDLLGMHSLPQIFTAVEL